MAVAHAAASHDPLPDSIVVETAVRDPHFREEVQQDHAEVRDGLVAGSCLPVQRGVLRSGKGDL